jgi:hypothetical protein
MLKCIDFDVIMIICKKQTNNKLIIYDATNTKD